MTTANIATTGGHKLDKAGVQVPVIVSGAGGAATYAYREFFDAKIRSDETRKAYRRAVHRFLAWCDTEGLSLTEIAPWHIREYIDSLASLHSGNAAATRTKKLHLTAIRKFFNMQVVRHAVVLNPALSVDSPKLDQREGSTPMIAPELVRQVFASIDVGSSDIPNIIGLRDKAILGVLAYTGARSGAVAKLRLRDYFTDGTQWFLRFQEKNGKVPHIPVRHDLQNLIDGYVNASGIGHEDDRSNPLFRACDGRSRVLSTRPLRCETVLMMVKRRHRNAGVPTLLTGHSYRVAVATDLLKQKVPLESVQTLLGHSDPRTTQIYDRGQRKVTRNIVERISH